MASKRYTQITVGTSVRCMSDGGYWVDVSLNSVEYSCGLPGWYYVRSSSEKWHHMPDYVNHAVKDELRRHYENEQLKIYEHDSDGNERTTDLRYHDDLMLRFLIGKRSVSQPICESHERPQIVINTRVRIAQDDSYRIYITLMHRDPEARVMQGVPALGKILRGHTIWYRFYRDRIVVTEEGRIVQPGEIPDEVAREIRAEIISLWRAGRFQFWLHEEHVRLKTFPRLPVEAEEFACRIGAEESSHADQGS